MVQIPSSPSFSRRHPSKCLERLLAIGFHMECAATARGKIKPVVIGIFIYSISQIGWSDNSFAFVSTRLSGPYADCNTCEPLARGDAASWIFLTCLLVAAVADCSIRRTWHNGQRTDGESMERHFCWFGISPRHRIQIDPHDHTASECIARAHATTPLCVGRKFFFSSSFCVCVFFCSLLCLYRHSTAKLSEHNQICKLKDFVGHFFLSAHFFRTKKQNRYRYALHVAKSVFSSAPSVEWDFIHFIGMIFDR